MRAGASLPEGCLLLLLYMYITSRPDRAASETQWLQLEQEVKEPEPLCGRLATPPHATPPEGRFSSLGDKRGFHSHR